MTSEEREAEERRRRRQIFWILKMKQMEEGQKTPPRLTTLRQEHDLWKTRAERRGK